MPEGTPHSFTLGARRHLEVVGVTHVDTFTDDTIVLTTPLGTLTVEGKALRINQLDLEAGRFTADGEVDSLTYSRRRPKSGEESLWQRIWR